MLKYKCMHEYILPFLVLNFFLNKKKSFYAAFFKVLTIKNWNFTNLDRKCALILVVQTATIRRDSTIFLLTPKERCENDGRKRG